MTWHLSKIPNIAHYFWDDRPLSFLRWLSIYSFSVLNPDWSIKLHVAQGNRNPSWPSANNRHDFAAGDYREWLGRINSLEVIKENDFAELHGVHQSDILRNRYLSECGGLWSDIDILYYKPMNSLICNRPENADHETGLCSTRRWTPIAFMLGAPGSAYFQTVYSHQLAIFGASGSTGGYQKFGTKVYQHVLKARQDRFFQIYPDEVYQHNWTMHHNIFAGMVNLSIGIGIHWYGGSASAARFEPLIHHHNWQDFPIGHIIKATYETEDHGPDTNIRP